MTARARRRREAGQALPEFALVAIIFFTLVFGVIQVGLVFAAQNGLVDGVRNAARRAATYRINDQSFDLTVWCGIVGTIETELITQLGDDRTGIVGFNPTGLTSDVAYEWVPNPEGDDWSLVARVSASYDHPLYVPLISFFLDGADGSTNGVLTLSATERMRVENPPLTNFPGNTPPSVPACP